MNTLQTNKSKRMQHFAGYIPVVLLLMLCSCGNDDDNQHEGSGCEFVQVDANMDGLIDETEQALISSCRVAAFTSKAEIESHLIGEWELIGHGEGWIPAISQPCARITVTDSMLTFDFDNGRSNFIETYTWEIEEVAWSGGTYFRLKLPSYVEGLFITNFCTDYMFGDATPSDGNMYLYEKVK